MRILRILKDSLGFLGITGDFLGYLRIPWDSWKFQGILEDSVGTKSWKFSGFCGILPKSLGILGDSPGFFENCARFLKCRTPRSVFSKCAYKPSQICYKSYQEMSWKLYSLFHW